MFFIFTLVIGDSGPEEVKISTDYIITGVYDSIGQLAKDELTCQTPKSFGVYVDSVAKETGATIKVKGFVRFETGEGIEKVEEDFAAEVAKQMNM